MSHYGSDAGHVPASHRFCARSNWTRARSTDPFLGRLVRQGQAAFAATLALILMGDWCGIESSTPLDRDAGIAEHHAAEESLTTAARRGRDLPAHIDNAC